MKKQLLTVSFALMVFLGVSAQTEPGHFYIQPGIGGVLSSFSGEQTDVIYFGRLNQDRTNGTIYQDLDAFHSTKLDLKGQIGLTFGIDAGYQLNKDWAVSLGIWYSRQKAKIDDQFVTPAQTMASYLTGDIVCRGDIHSDFISIPLKVHYYLWHGLALFAGTEVDVLVKSKCELDYGPKQMLDQGHMHTHSESNYDGFRNTLSLSALAGASYEYKHFVLSMSYHLGLTKVFDGSISSEDPVVPAPWIKTSLRNNSLRLTLGYKFEL